MHSTITKNKVMNSLFWSTLDRGGDQVIRFIISLILARLLLPEMFGLIAMINIVFDVAQAIINGGLGLSLVNKRDHTRNDECVVFIFNVSMSIFCCIAMLLTAPYVAHFYKNPELTSIIRVLSISFCLSSFSSIQNVLLLKKMDFKKQALINMITTLLSGGMGIGFAFAGFGVWSLVIQLIARAMINSVLLWIFCPWRPSLLFDLKSFTSLLSYGSKLFLSDIVTIISNNFYSILIGRAYNAETLAYFWRGKQLQQLPNDAVWAAISRVAFPAFSLLKSDTEKMVASFKRAICLLAFLLLPAMFIMSACSKNLVLFLYSAKWIDCAIYLKIFCLSGAFTVMESLTNNVVAGAGKSGYSLCMNIFQKVALISSLLISSRYGIIWMAVAYSFTSIITFCVNYFIYCRIFKQPILQEIIMFFPYLIFGILSYFACLFMTYAHFPLLMELISQLLIGSMVYLILNMFFKTKGFIEVLDILKPYLKTVK